MLTYFLSKPMKNILHSRNNENILASALSLLNIKYTDKYANKHFNEHPHKNDMFGISRMFSHFGVENVGLKIADKEKNIHELEPPFIAHIGSNFVTVENVSEDNVRYFWDKKLLTVPIGEFINMWSGITLAIEADENSKEPDYEAHRKEEFVGDVQKLLLFVGVIVLMVIGIFQSRIYQDIGLSVLLLLNIIGVYTGYLLVLKQLNIKSNQADKICSLFAKGECNDVLDSPAAKFMGVIGWSELGFSYFLSNTFILLFAPQYLYYLTLINILALPYSFWSVWYQKFKAKTWCPLCLIVQLLFWLMFATSLISGFIHIPDFTFAGILSVGLTYGIPFLIITLSLPYLAEGQKVMNITQELNSLKMNEEIFLSLLKNEVRYPVDKQTSAILFGNPDAKNMITVFTNPHCGPCARMHAKIEQLLKDADNKLCVQYMLCSFGDELNSSNEFFIYVNRNFPAEERNRIYNEWFEGGKLEKESFFNKYGFAYDDKISDEHSKHLEWKESTKLRSTPTVLFNGYELPKLFFQQIESLAFFADLDVDSN